MDRSFGSNCTPPTTSWHNLADWSHSASFYWLVLVGCAWYHVVYLAPHAPVWDIWFWTARSKSNTRLTPPPTSDAHLIVKFGISAVRVDQTERVGRLKLHESWFRRFVPEENLGQPHCRHTVPGLVNSLGTEMCFSSYLASDTRYEFKEHELKECCIIEALFT